MNCDVQIYCKYARGHLESESKAKFAKTAQLLAKSNEAFF